MNNKIMDKTVINKRRAISSVYIWIILAIFTASSSAAELVDNTLKPEGTMLVPDTFLRSWDPVTIFFNNAQGRRAGAPEDHPEKLLQLEPSHPGAYTWLDQKTLQFRPAEPWPPLAKYRWTISGKSTSLNTLMSAPISSLPAHNHAGLNQVEDITLTFTSPIDVTALKQMLRIELRELPGIDSNKSYWLKPGDFDIKVVERSNSNQPASYVISLSKPIGSGQMIKVHLRLTLHDSVDDSFHIISFSTAKSFEVSKLGCPGSFYPINANGSLYDENAAIQCSSNNRKIQLQFSAQLGAVDPIAARNLVHLTPMIDNISYSANGNTLTVRGDFKTDQMYQVNLQPTAMRDINQRELNISKNSELFLFFPQQANFLHWETSQGIMERFGPQMLPLKGVGSNGWICVFTLLIRLIEVSGLFRRTQ